ncbi:L-lactate dehydrogenase [Sphingomonas hengshuiensis]|uniref:L-lactate dehydrogenase n=1 Tax=Sphingomonas hengshuiensis TaxID=1609977 RepID=A0A7U5BE42_9SPHN|nr:L-lactate dehydrogenase [Sphingomonas hengshuiensis]AJP70628.1 lactate dehydrogenase [Sphingomonas hengshuiensis]
MTSRIAIIGAGHVGATTAYALMLRGLFAEIVLIDTNAELAAAEAADISDAGALTRPTRVFAGSYADAASARIAVLTAGAATHGSESRLAVTARSAAIVTACVTELRAAGFDGILVVASNPVDVMARTAFRCSAMPAARVIGTGTLLDSLRLRQEIATRLHVAPASVDAMVLGEHGDSEVAILSSIRVGGQPIAQFESGHAPLDLPHIAEQVRCAAYDIMAGKGYTSFGVATAAVRICEAIARDEHVVLPVSSLLTGQFGLEDLYLSLPCLVGAGGIERTMIPELNHWEQTAFQASAAAVQAAIDGIVPPA